MSIQTFSKIGEGCYVVIFRSLLAEDSKGYSKTAERMKKLVSQLEHLAAQKKGKEKWYSAYSIQVCKIEKDYFNNKR